MSRVAIGILSLGIALASATPCAVLAADVSALLEQAEATRSTNPESFATALAELEKVQSTVTEKQRWQLRLLKAYQAVMKGGYNSAIKQAIEVNNEATDPDIKFRASLLIANTAAITRDFSLGLRHLESALSMAGSVRDAEVRQTGYGVAALLYNQHGQYALGRQYADQLLSQNPAPRNRCYAKQIRIEASYGLGVALDENEINTAIADCVAQNEAILSNLLRGYLARRWAGAGDTARAVSLLESHLEEVHATGYPRLIGEIHGLLAEYRFMRGESREAEQHAMAVLATGERDTFSLPIVTAHKVLYEVALRRKDLAAALVQYRHYAEADKARLDEIKAREFAFQLSRNELQQKNQAIELLQKQNEVLRLEQEVSKAATRNTQLLLALLAMILAAIGYWAYKVKRVQVMFRRQAEVDGLTGISNRRYFRENAEALLQRCAVNGREASLVLLDLDHFKHINDRHGHAVGDWVLQQVALAIQAACREGDVCGRLGGEEFAILSCGSDMDAARRIAQRCSEHLAAIDTTVIGRVVTASFGCTTSARSGYAFESMFAHADAAMYQAKAGGRDRVRAYGEGGVGSGSVLELVRG